ncbi:MAG: hypothetical protein K8F31_08205 [Roseovarius sp.]|nr:hypothetical protein [Roseovarius sp.]
MAQTADTTPLSPETADGATQDGALPHDRPVLLGTFLAPAGNRALMRSGTGEIVSLNVGDRIESYRVAAIAEGEVMLVVYNQVHRLGIPGRP